MTADTGPTTGAATPDREGPTGEGSYREGNALDALKIRDFRRIFLASVASGTGRWMQNVTLGIFAYKLDGSKSFATLVVGVQTFPMLLLSVIGGSLADTVDRRKLLILTQCWQAVWGAVLAWQVWDEEIGRLTLLSLVFIIGVGQSLFAPAFSAIVPSLVGRENLSAAIALNSMMINGTRIAGPVLGTALLSVSTLSVVFLVNSGAYLIIIAVLAITTIPTLQRTTTLSLGDRFLGGFRVAARSEQIRRPLLVMVTFSLCCLPFLGLLPAIAEERWGVDSRSTTYGFIYAGFGLGATLGALAVGAGLGRRSRAGTVRITLALFAVSLAAMSTASSAATAGVTMFFLGLFYFMMPTVLNTFLQEHLADGVRGRVLALWLISFGGTVSVANFASGAIAELTSLPTVLYFGVVVALALALLLRLRPGPIADETLLHNGQVEVAQRPD